MPDKRRVVGAMFVLTFVGFLLLVPPLVHLFNHDLTVFGIPQIVIYLFGVWLLLVIGTGLLTRLLRPEAQPKTEADEA